MLHAGTQTWAVQMSPSSTTSTSIIIVHDHQLGVELSVEFLLLEPIFFLVVVCAS